MLKYLLLIIVLAFSCQTVFATDINVATPVTAATINTAIASASPGDNVIIPDGTYSDLDQINVPSSVDGTEVNPITLKPVTAGGVTFSGLPAELRVMDVQGDWWIIRDFKFIDISKSGAAITYGINTKNATGTRITNNYFEGFGTLTSAMSRCIWIAHDGSGNQSRVDHNTFTGNRAVDIMLSATDGGAQALNCQIDHNYFNETRTDWYAGMQIGTGDSVANNAVDLNTIVEYNLFKDMNQGGTIVSNKSSSNTYRYNVFKQPSIGNNSCLTIRMGDDCIVEGNYFFDVKKQNIRVHGTGHKIINNYFENPDYSAILLADGNDAGGSGYAHISDVLIANNTIINPIYRGIWIGWWSGGTIKPNNLTFKNNIITSSDGNLVRDGGHTGTFTWTTNLHYATSGASYWVNDGGGAEPGAGITHGDPSLTLDSTFGFYRLQSSSSNAIENGTVDGNVTDDIDGDTRDGSTPDIGCDEYFSFASVSPSRVPVLEANVGVSWLVTPVLPLVTSQSVDGIGTTTATGHGTIANTGGENATKRGICWNTTGNPTVADDNVTEVGNFSTGAFSGGMTGLTPDQAYFARAYAYNTAGYGYGSTEGFGTDADANGTYVIDNGDNGTSSTGTWSVSSGANPYGSDSLYSHEVNATYTYEKTLDGNYTTSIWWTEYASRSSSVTVKIYDSGDNLLDIKSVNQTTLGGQWNEQDTYDFNATAKVVILSTGGAGPVSTCADAVKFDYVEGSGGEDVNDPSCLHGIHLHGCVLN